MKKLLLHLFQTSSTVASWYAPLQAALDGLNEEQARWRPEQTDHSIAGIVAHLHFYQHRELEKFRGNKPPDFSGSNSDTFTEPKPGEWNRLVGETMSTLAQFEKEITAADTAKLEKSANLLGELAAHLAYHTGQIVLLRKWQQSWDPDKGVS